MDIRTRARLPGRERLLDAAESLFADKGYDGASLRAITRAAEVELGLANYHFGTKDELYRQVVLRRAPVMAGDLEAALLDALQEDSLEAIFAAFARTHFIRRYDDNAGWRSYIKLAAGIALKGNDQRLISGASAIYGPTFDLYRQAIGKFRPELSSSEVECTFYVFQRAVLSLLINTGRGAGPAEEDSDPAQWMGIMLTLVRTFARGA